MSGNEVIVGPSPSDQHPVNYDAGADLLHKNQTEWNQLHLLAEDNAHKSEVLQYFQKNKTFNTIDIKISGS